MEPEMADNPKLTNQIIRHDIFIPNFKDNTFIQSFVAPKRQLQV
jgi:hypothetical protein